MVDTLCWAVFKIHYNYWSRDSAKNSEKKRRFRDFGEKYTFDRKTNATSVFISSMPMIFIFGLAKKYLLEKSYVGFMIKFVLYLTHDYRLFLCKTQCKCIRVPCISVIVYRGKVSKYGSNQGPYSRRKPQHRRGFGLSRNGRISISRGGVNLRAGSS